MKIEVGVCFANIFVTIFTYKMYAVKHGNRCIFSNIFVTIFALKMAVRIMAVVFAHIFVTILTYKKYALKHGVRWMFCPYFCHNIYSYVFNKRACAFILFGNLMSPCTALF